MGVSKWFISLFNPDIKPQLLQDKIFSKPDHEKDLKDSINAKILEIEERAQPFTSNESFCGKLTELTQEARVYAFKNDWVFSQQAVTEACELVNRSIISEAYKRIKFRIVVFPLIWFVVLYGFEYFVKQICANNISITQIWAPYFQFLWLGMLGGMTMVWFGIVKHTTDQSFDPAFVVWCYLKPVLGAIMGIVVVLVIQSGVIVLQGSADKTNPTFLHVIAFVAGYSERFFLNMIDKVVTAVLGGDTIGAKSSSSKTKRPSSSSTNNDSEK